MPLQQSGQRHLPCFPQPCSWCKDRDRQLHVFQLSLCWWNSLLHPGQHSRCHSMWLLISWNGDGKFWSKNSICLALLDQRCYFRINALQRKPGGRMASCRASQEMLLGISGENYRQPSTDCVTWAIWIFRILESFLPKYHSDSLIYHMIWEKIVRSFSF